MYNLNTKPNVAKHMSQCSLNKFETRQSNMKSSKVTFSFTPWPLTRSSICWYIIPGCWGKQVL